MLMSVTLSSPRIHMLSPYKGAFLIPFPILRKVRTEWIWLLSTYDVHSPGPHVRPTRRHWLSTQHALETTAGTGWALVKDADGEAGWGTSSEPGAGCCAGKAADLGTRLTWVWILAHLRIWTATWANLGQMCNKRNNDSNGLWPIR